MRFPAPLTSIIYKKKEVKNMGNYTKKETHIFSLERQKYLFEVTTLRVYEIDDLTEKILTDSKEFSLESILNQFAGV
jgi:hypothetical protein